MLVDYAAAFGAIGQLEFFAFAYGTGILTISIALIVLLAREMFGRDLKGYFGFSTRTVRWIVFVLSSLKFFLMGGMIFLGLSSWNLPPIPLSIGAMWSLAAFTLSGISVWLWQRRGERNVLINVF